ncbi:hypothetical protein CYMTET_22885 [Cymbomonas tetramitiformis]|uniref:C2H2-type domain-containing protein n=1 Tax=Cymbomonas tetramitiformis TaxID=36881 RepID=A0AAE0FZD4_9CHLO|nr:hypothetical protein CYMTET_22885 [Cymbomonas tetramitiformis]
MYDCSVCGASLPSRNKLFAHLRNGACSASPPSTREEALAEDAGEERFIYVVGGRNRGRTLCEVERFHISRGQWEKCSSLKESRGSHGVAACGGVLYAIGGGGIDSNLASCEMLEPRGGEAWRALPPVSLARHALCAVTLGQVVYAIGGWVDGTYCSALMEELHVPSNSWSQRAAMLHPRRLHGACAWGERVYVFGGAGDHDKATMKWAECYDPKEDQWHAIKDLPVAGVPRLPCRFQRQIGAGCFDGHLSAALLPSHWPQRC